MDHEGKILSLLEKVAKKVDRIEEDLNSVKGIVMALENGLNSKVGILFDGHSAQQEKRKDHDE